MWLSDEERKRTSTADDAAFPSPVPTQIVSNGEYNPMPQTEKQRQVEARIKELADKYAAKLNMDRRTFLKTASGMATAFLAMNQVFGPIWDVSEAEAADIDMSDARAKALQGQFIFDDQTHFVRDDFDKEGLLGLGKYASEHWNPDMLKDIPLVLQRYKLQNYLKEIYLDSDTKVALLSGAPFDDPDWWLLSNDQIIHAREAINKVAGSRRMFATHDDHARTGRVDGRSRSRYRRTEARFMEVLHDRGSAVAVHQRHCMAPGRRGSGLSVVREGDEVGHQDHLYSQGPAAARLRNVLAGGVETRHRGRRAQGRERLAATQFRHLPRRNAQLPRRSGRTRSTSSKRPVASTGPPTCASLPPSMAARTSTPNWARRSPPLPWPARVWRPR